MTKAFAHADLNELALCHSCQKLCHADETACPACTSGKLILLKTFRQLILAIIEAGQS